MRLRYTFLSGLPTRGVKIGSYDPWRRKVTVGARCYMDAIDKARNELDRRAYKSGSEPPVCWDLEFIGAKR